MEKYCPKCDRHYPIKHFGKNSSTKSGYNNLCKECYNKYMQAYHSGNKKHLDRVNKYRKNNMVKVKGIKHAFYEKRMKFISEFKTECCICREKRKPCLEFHHKDRNKKLFTIGKFVFKSREAIVDEINKCVVLCANCHRKVEYGSLRGYKFD